MPNILGLDLGNAKLKMVHLDYTEDWASSDVVWKSVPLPYTEDRLSDFSSGIPLHIRLFALIHKLKLTDLDAVVVCSSHAYSYPNMVESITHLTEILSTIFESTPVFLARADGFLSPLKDVCEMSDADLYGYVLTNFLGSAYLGTKLIKNGISMDIGTTTTDLIPIVEGQLDPEGLKTPQDYLDFRYANQRIHWLGLTVTPLSMLCSSIQLKGKTYQVVPRHYGTDAVFSLLAEQEQSLLKSHAYGQSFPDPEQARYQLAQFVGLDQVLLSPLEIMEIHAQLYQSLESKLMQRIESVALSQFNASPKELEFAVFALGETLLALPTLKKLGVPLSHIKRLQVKRDSALWSASSAFSMALMGLEKVLKRTVDLPYES